MRTCQFSRTFVPVFLGIFICTVFAQEKSQLQSPKKILPPPPVLLEDLKPKPKKKIKKKKRITRNVGWGKYDGTIVQKGSGLFREIALTFDDGPFPPYTQQILAILKKHNVRATFFVVGQMVKAYPHLLVQTAKEGHEIANHSWTHHSVVHASPQQSLDEILKPHNLIHQLTGLTPVYFRPPYGSYQYQFYKTAEQFGYSIVMWTVAPGDWVKNKSAQTLVHHVVSNAQPGAIVLLHDGGGNRSATVAALPIIIEKLQAKGYSIVPLRDMLSERGKIILTQSTRTEILGSVVPQINQPVSILNDLKPSVIP